MLGRGGGLRETQFHRQEAVKIRSKQWFLRDVDQWNGATWGTLVLQLSVICLLGAGFCAELAPSLTIPQSGTDPPCTPTRSNNRVQGRKREEYPESERAGRAQGSFPAKVPFAWGFDEVSFQLGLPKGESKVDPREGEGTGAGDRRARVCQVTQDNSSRL